LGLNSLTQFFVFLLKDVNNIWSFLDSTQTKFIQPYLKSVGYLTWYYFPRFHSVNPH